MMRKNGRLEGRYTVPRISHINLNTLTSREMQKLCKGLRENEAPRKAEDAAAVAQQLYGAWPCSIWRGSAAFGKVNRWSRGGGPDIAGKTISVSKQIS